MKFSKLAQYIRRGSRFLHRELSFFFSGMVLIYALSGVMMNHRDSINPHYSVEKKEYVTDVLPAQADMKKEDVLRLLAPLGEEKHYTKHYFPQPGVLKVFLKGGSSLVVECSSRKAVYENLTRRPIWSALAKLHYNPGRWWTYFADLFAVGLIVITVTGLVMLKGPKGLWGRGGVELLLGIAVPLLFLLA